MTERRAYRSAVRSSQARQTRAIVIGAVTSCVIRDGYAQTTMKQIAAEAGVSLQTVFAQGTKPALLLAAVDRAIVGDDEEIPLIGRDPFVRLLSSTDRVEKLTIMRDIYGGWLPAGPLLVAFERASVGDPVLAEAWADYELRRYQDYRSILESFAPWWRDGLTLDRATDEFWSVFSIHQADLMMRVRSWPVPDWARFWAESFERLFLRTD